MTAFDLVIAGAGPAGSALALRMARAGRSVLLCERKAFPRDKLCGEFISPEGLIYLRALGLEAAVRSLGGAAIGSALIASAGGGCLERALPGTALGVSRGRLDQCLLEAARAAGAEVRTECRVRSAQPARAAAGATAFEVESLVGGGRVVDRAGAVVDAAGRQGGLDWSDTPPRERPDRGPAGPVAFQCHFVPAAAEAGRRPDGAVEMYLFAGGYCGISPIEGGRINVCFLDSGVSLPDSGVGGRPPDGARRGSEVAPRILARVASQNPFLRDRLRSLRLSGEGWLSAAGLRFEPRASSGGWLAVGDAAGAIAPLCGDGISMALRSAEIAAANLEGYLRGRFDWNEVLCRQRRAWHSEFGPRMRIGRHVHQAATRPLPSSLLLRVGRGWPRLIDHLILGTRDRKRIEESSPGR